MKRTICLIWIILSGAPIGAGAPLLTQVAQAQTQQKPVRLVRIPYGEKPYTAPLYPYGVDDVYEPSVQFEMMDAPSEGPYMIRASEDGKYLAIHFSNKLLILSTNVNSSKIEKEIYGKYFYIDFISNKLYSIFNKTITKEWVDPKGIIHVGATEELWQLEVRDPDGNLLKSETKVLTAALNEAVKAGWKPSNNIKYVDRKNNIYIISDNPFQLPMRQIPSILRISPSGKMDYIIIKVDKHLLKSENYIVHLMIRNEKIYAFIYFDPAKPDLSVKDKKGRSIRWGYPLQQADIFIYDINGNFINHYSVWFKRNENKKYGIDMDLFDIIRIDNKNRIYFKSFINGGTWNHISCEVKMSNIENAVIEEDLLSSDTFSLAIFATISYVVWVYDLDKKVWRTQAQVEEPIYGGSFALKTSCWDVDAHGNLYYLKWAKDALEVWMVPASK